MDVSFVLPEHFDRTERDTWVLHGPNGAQVCALPCERQVTPSGGYFFQLTRVSSGGSVDIKRVNMPPTFASLPAGRWYVVPHEGRGNQLVAGLLLIPAVPVSFFGVVGGVALISDWMNDQSTRGASLVGGALLLGASAALIAAHAYWLAWSRPAGVSITSTITRALSGTF
jgi:hypothetical protein